MNSTSKTKKIILIAMMCAIAYVVMLIGRVPIVMFLKYDPKDVIITIGGFILGPLASFIISLIVSFVEMLTASDTGIIGCVMNIISSCAFACTAAAIYKKNHTISGAVIGLASGCAAMTVIMLLWNYFLTPIYLGYPRQAVADMLLPVFLPFNLVKSGLNTAITLLLYKPIVTALRKAQLVEIQEDGRTKVNRTGIVLISTFLLATSVVFALILKGVI